jgi:hypothetical protein
MGTRTCIVDETNLSIAWLKAFEASLKSGVSSLAPLVVNVSGLEEKGVENVEIRRRLDTALKKAGLFDCHTVANTIFPQQLWKRSSSRQDLFDRYRKMLPRIRRRHPANRYGTYFGRMIQFGKESPYVDQLSHVLEVAATVKRPTAYQLNIFDPAQDHTRQPRRGFPCLQHVSFTPLGTGKLAVVANYPAQYMFEKAYGNYLGLYNLGRFVADQLKLDLTRLTCVVGKALPGDEPKTTLRRLVCELTSIVGSIAPAQLEVG